MSDVAICSLILEMRLRSRPSSAIIDFYQAFCRCYFVFYISASETSCATFGKFKVKNGEVEFVFQNGGWISLPGWQFDSGNVFRAIERPSDDLSTLTKAAILNKSPAIFVQSNPSFQRLLASQAV